LLKRAISGRKLNEAFDLWQKGDYREQAVVTREQVAPFIDWARKFIDSVKNYLKGSGRI
jgi:uncharacterized protein (UPF0332 family)